MNDEDISQFMKAFEDFMKHSEVEQLKYEVRIDNVNVVIPEENQLIASYESKAAELEVTVDYYMAEFI
jgi:hypothetical protein